METLLMGIAIGIALAICLFVLVNLEIPTRLDEMEGEVRSHTEGYKAGKTSAWAWIKGKFRKDSKVS